MSISADVVCTSYAFCRRLSRGAGSNFYAGFFLLPSAKRRATDALYAFMRHTDDLADNPVPSRPRGEALIGWRAALEHALQGHFGLHPNDRFQLHRIQYAEDQIGVALLPALVDAVRRFHVPPEHLRAVIDGVETDLQKRRYETFDELELYCRRVAAAVGLACIYVWGFRGPQALVPAAQAGIALQLTNILRDLKEDAEADRVYLPAEEMRQCGYSVDDLLHGVVNDRFQRLMALQIKRAEEHYRGGAELLTWLEPDGQRVFGMMMATYRAILAKIKRCPGDVLKGRVTLSRGEKLQIAARWTFLPPSAAALG